MARPITTPLTVDDGADPLATSSSVFTRRIRKNVTAFSSGPG